MPKEIKADGDLKFDGFASYPNSATFDPSGGILEYAENVVIEAGVVSPRLGYTVAYNGYPDAVSYACSAHGPSGDSILLWDQNKRFNCNSGSVTTVNLASKQKARGQGYADAVTMETLDSDWEAGANITERLVTAKDDRCRFTLYTGNLPYEPDDLRLVQGTYDPIQAIVPSNNAFIAFGKRSIYSVTAGMGRQAIFDRVDRGVPENVFHRSTKISEECGLSAKDGVAVCGENVFFVDKDGIRVISQGKFNENDAPLSDQIKDIWALIDPTKYSQITAVSIKQRVYISLPLLAPYQKSCVLVLNTAIKGMFESLNVYVHGMDILVKARKNGVMRLWGVNKENGIIYLLDEGTLDVGALVIQSKIRSRNYMFQSHSDKKYDDVYCYFDTNGYTSFDLNFISVNPDGKWTLDTFTGKSLGTVVRRALANKKSMGGKLEIVTRGGQPKIYSIGVEGSLVGRSIFSSF